MDAHGKYLGILGCKRTAANEIVAEECSASPKKLLKADKIFNIETMTTESLMQSSDVEEANTHLRGNVPQRAQLATIDSVAIGSAGCEGIQSTFTSASAIAVAAFEGTLNNFSTRNVDTILNCGNKLYVNTLQGDTPRYISPDETNTLSLTIEGCEVILWKPVNMVNGSYPLIESFDDIISGLPQEANTGYMFAGNQKTVAFWKTIDERNDVVYYAFSSHGTESTDSNKTQLFKTQSVNSLCSFLIMSTGCDHGDGEYNIHRVETSIKPRASRFNCVAIGTKSQQDMIGGNNTQCVVMSACANALSVANGGTEFTTEEIDCILNHGNDIYLNQVLQGGPTRLIYPEEIPNEFDVAGYKFHVTTPDWVHSSVFPKIKNDPQSVLELTRALNTLVFNDTYTNQTGLFFTGQGATISFWRDRTSTSDSSDSTAQEVYYLFNSHAVNDHGVYDIDDPRKNKARLFKLHDLTSLAALLIKDKNSLTPQEYTIEKMTVTCKPGVQNILKSNATVATISTKTEADWTLMPKKRGHPTIEQDVSSNQLEIMTCKSQWAILNVEEIDLNTAPTVTTTSSYGKKTEAMTVELQRMINGDQNISDVESVITTTSIPVQGETIPTKKKPGRPKKVKRNTKQKENKYNVSKQDKIETMQMELKQVTYIDQIISDSESVATTTSTVTEAEIISAKKKPGRPKKVKRDTKQKEKQDIVSKQPKIETMQVELEQVIIIDQIVSDSESVATTTSIVTETEIIPAKKKPGRPKKTKQDTKQNENKHVSKQNKIETMPVELGQVINIDQIDSDSESVATTTSTVTEAETIPAKKKPGRPKKIKRGTKQKENKYNVSKQDKIETMQMKLKQITYIDQIVSDSESVATTTSTVTEAETIPTKKKLGRPKKIIQDTKQQENKYIELEQVINIEQIVSDSKSVAEAETIPVKISSGCPIKVKRGRTKQTENAHLEASKKYNKANPDINRKAVAQYKEINPAVNVKTVTVHKETHPEAHKEASQNYRESNREQIIEANRRYNTEDRNIPPLLRRRGLICEKSGKDLETIQLYKLKNTTLQSSTTCSICRAPFFQEELSRKEWCCGHGRYNILNLPPITEEFYSDPQFIRRSRAYNNLFAFSALGTSGGWQHPQTGISFIKVLGRIYHRVFDLSYNQTANNIGHYIDDGAERQRLADEIGLNREIVSEITNYMNNVNPYIDCFKRLSLEPSEQAHLIFEHTTRQTHGNILGDMPRGTEVAAILATESEPYTPKSIAIWKIGQSRAHTVDIFHPLYESLQFPLLYPHGGAGWTINTQGNNDQKLSQLKYYRCLLLSEHRFSQLGRLSDEWLVDMYCRVEEERLRYFANQQKTDSSNQLRSAPLEEIQTNVLLREDETIQSEGGVTPGRVYLPSSFTNSPRYMQLKYMNAIAVVNRLGKPSYFLTMTCNPKWEEIQNSTTSSESSASVTARVFNLKLMELLQDLRNPMWFGGLVYIMYVIEFQKRGLPHAHICFRVKGGGPVQNTEIDRVIRADIPPESEANGQLRERVLKHMMHGPCGREHRTNLPCWDDKTEKCIKYFPKNANEITYVDEKGFVHLKRNAENTGTITYMRRNVTVNDQWVVAYNAALLLKYDCHINLDIVSTQKVFKYLYKYLTKGPDEARVALVPDAIKHDEVEQYATRRYVGACDAAWRMLEFDVTNQKPVADMLPVHLENRQMIFFKKGNETEALDRNSSKQTKYFNRPTGPEFDTLTYLDFYENYFVYAKRPTVKNSDITIYECHDGITKFFVKKRQRGECVARLFWVPPNRGEQFYLRLLLNVHPCRGYDDLRALGGTNCTTFQEAAKAVGLADDQLEYETCLQEAATFYVASRLRRFFVLLITNEAPGAILWERFKNALSEDYLRRCPGSQAEEELAYKRALLDIDRLLRRHGSCLVEHGLPYIEDDTTELGRERDEYGSEASTRLQEYTELWLPQLSPEQRRVFEHVNSLLMNDQPSMTTTTTTTDTCPTAIFLDGPSGTGKTLLLNVIVAHVRGVLKRVAVCTASSGIAAQNYEGGCTAHTMFRLPLELIDDNGFWNLTNGSQRAELIRAASLIIYDEAPMAHKYLINLLDRSLRDLMNCNQLFGGKLIILAGDFRQIPPVVPRARTTNIIVQASLRTSHIWPQLVKFTLNQAQRTRSDQTYSDFLLRLGSGQCQLHAIDPNHRTMVSLQNSVSVVKEVDELIDFVYPPEVLLDADMCASRAILSTHNINVKEINARIMERIDGEYIHCYSVDSVDPELANEFYLGPETLNRVQASGVPDHDLPIKIGSVCMITRNLSFVDRLVNGTKVIVVNVSPRLITVRKPFESDVFLIPRITFKTPIERNSTIQMIRRMFPLQVSYALTIHKSQGQTLERIGVDLRSDVFSHGQLYVALGRVRDHRNIRVLVQSDHIIDNIPFVNNVVIANLIN